MKGAGKGRRTTGGGIVTTVRDRSPFRYGHAGFGLPLPGKRIHPVPHPAAAARLHGGRSPDASSRPFGRGRSTASGGSAWGQYGRAGGHGPCGVVSAKIPDGGGMRPRFAVTAGRPIGPTAGIPLPRHVQKVLTRRFCRGIGGADRPRTDGNPDGFPLPRDPNAEEAGTPGRSGLPISRPVRWGYGSAWRRTEVSAKPGSRAAGSPRAGRAGHPGGADGRDLGGIGAAPEGRGQRSFRGLPFDAHGLENGLPGRSAVRAGGRTRPERTSRRRAGHSAPKAESSPGITAQRARSASRTRSGVPSISRTRAVNTPVAPSRT